MLQLYMINDNENELKLKNRSQRYDIYGPRTRHGKKHAKYKMCLNIMIVMCIKKYLSNI